MTETETKLLLYVTGTARVDKGDVLKAAGNQQGVIDVALEALQRQGLLWVIRKGEGFESEPTDAGRKLARQIIGEDAAT